MSKDFHSFSNTDHATIKAALDALKTGGYRDLQAISCVPSIGRNSVPSDDFRLRLSTIQSRFNLDRSEASRRIFIDAFLVECLNHGAKPAAIVTAEHTIARDNNKLGHGRLDYLISSIQQGGLVSYLPSIVIEAKKSNIAAAAGLSTNGAYQLIAEMVTLAQLQSSRLPPFLRGILTDGRHWQFIEIETGGQDAVIYHTALNDIVRQLDPMAFNDNFLGVYSLLIRWLGNYDSRSSQLTMPG